MIKSIIIKKENLSDKLSNIQDYFINEVYNNYKFYFDRYKLLKESFNGKYISSDIFKKTFDIYNESIDNARNYSPILHNSVAVLAGEYFNQEINNNIKECIIISGSPGSGKSTYINNLFKNNKIDKNTLIYEGNITGNDIYQKIDLCVKKGIKITLIIMNSSFNNIINNINKRYIETGLDAERNLVSRLLSNIPNSVNKIITNYKVKLIILENKDNKEIKTINDINYLYKGTYQEIYNNLKGLR